MQQPFPQNVYALHITLTLRNIFYLYMFAAGRNLDEDDNTKAEAAKMQKEYENLKDSTKEEQPSTATSQSSVQTRRPQESLLALSSVISEP